ncbi:MAG: hypothetical protein J0L51_12985 [Rhizobiales bacterium]|nr:hypothetical protein [Hyphomicrobiales bacterium]
MTTPGGQASRLNPVLIAILGLAIGAAALFLVFRKPATPPLPPAATASSPTVPAAVTPPAPAPKPVVVIEKAEWPGKFYSFTLNGITVTGSNLSKAEIEELLRSDNATALKERLAKFNADEMRIASLVIESPIKGQTSTTTYENMVARRIQAGMFGEITVPVMRQTASLANGPDKTIDYTLVSNQTRIEAFDLLTILRWVTEADPSGNGAFKPIYGQYSVESTEVAGQQFSASVGKVAMTGMRVKPMRRAMTEMWPSLEALIEQSKKPDPDFNLGFVADLLDIYASLDFGSFSIGPVAGKITGLDQANGEFKFAGMRYTSGATSHGEMDPFEFVRPDGAVRLRSTKWNGDFYQFIFATLAKIGLENPPADAKPEDIERLKAAAARTRVPDFGFSLADLSVDVPPAGRSSERVRFAFDEMGMRYGAFVGITPTSVGASMKKFQMPIPAGTRDATLLALRAMGFETLNWSFNLDGAWDEAKSAILFRDLSSSLENMGSLGLNFELGNVPRSFFENPTANWTAVLLGGTIRHTSLILSNRGGFEKLVGELASKQGKTADQLQQEMSALAPAILASMMAGHPDLNAVSDAIVSFLRGLNELSLKARGTDADGVKMLDLAGAKANPIAFLRKLRLEAAGK